MWAFRQHALFLKYNQMLEAAVFDKLSETCLAEWSIYALQFIILLNKN